MSIYTPRYFTGSDSAAARRLIEQHPFATLITSRDGVEPQISYLPLRLENDVLLGHLAKANPHWQQFADGHTLALFHGPHAYVSPGWFQVPADNVPTWNYAVVHAHGKPELLDDVGAHRVVTSLTEHFDPGKNHTDPAEAQRLLKGIVAFRMPIARLDAKFKMSQNKPVADRHGVIAGLRASGRPDDAAVADWMQAE